MAIHLTLKNITSKTSCFSTCQESEKIQMSNESVMTMNSMTTMDMEATEFGGGPTTMPSRLLLFPPMLKNEISSEYAGPLCVWIVGCVITVVVFIPIVYLLCKCGFHLHSNYVRIKAANSVKPAPVAPAAGSAYEDPQVVDGNPDAMAMVPPAVVPPLAPEDP